MSGLTEKLLSTWLTNVDERGLQHVFCVLLMRKGHRVVHSTVHNAMEMGKDIVSVNETGELCVYQLKSTTSDRITQNDFRDDIQPQIRDLTTLAVSVPGVRRRRPDKAYIVVNAKFREEVHRQIADYNDAGEGCPLGVIGYDEILGDLTCVGADIWPADVQLTKDFLELYMDDGHGDLPAEKYSGLMFGLIDDVYRNNIRGKAAGVRLLTSLAVVAELATTPWRKVNNHWPLIQADCLSLMASEFVSARWKISKQNRSIFNALYQDRMFSELRLMSDEICDKEFWQLVTGDEVGGIGSAKIIHLTAILCLSSMVLNNHEYDEKCRRLIKVCRSQRFLWGEYAVPQILAIIVWLYRNESSNAAEDWMCWLVGELLSLTMTQSRIHYPPWQRLDEKVAKDILGIDDEVSNTGQTKESHWLETAVRIAVRLNLKTYLKGVWPLIADSAKLSFFPDDRLDWLRYKADKGRNHHQAWVPPHSWSKIINESQGEKPDIELINNDPYLHLLILLVCPHRINSQWFLCHLRELMGTTWH
ncbi:hypothetical protein LBMAG53_39580 [Planctomycetota bacterium]|nr:hypothetical protein LBMAG53_39580 [Planctomycetota bacterium]